ncbi:TPA: hypothetical protein ACKN06_002138, partial [Neisseria gonorrhoeae]
FFIISLLILITRPYHDTNKGGFLLFCGIMTENTKQESQTMTFPLNIMVELRCVALRCVALRCVALRCVAFRA